MKKYLVSLFCSLVFIFGCCGGAYATNYSIGDLLNHATVTASGTVTLTTASAWTQFIDPDGSDRDVTLPALSGATDQKFWISNSANGSGEDLTVKEAAGDGGSTIATLGPGMGVLFSCDGTSWRAIRESDVVWDEQGGVLTISDTLDMSGNYFTNSQSIADLNAKGTSYWFDGVDDDVTLAGGANLIFGDGEFTILSTLFATDSGAIIGAANNGIAFDISGWALRMGKRGVNDLTESTGTIAASTQNIVGYTRSGTDGIYYINGENAGAITDANDYTVATTKIGQKGIDAVYFNGQISSTKLFNLALDPTDATDNAIINGGDVPFKYAGASQTELHVSANAASDPNANEANATTGWTANNCTMTSDGVVFNVGSFSLKFVDNGGTSLADTEIAVTPGKRYLLAGEYYVPSTNTAAISTSDIRVYDTTGVAQGTKIVELEPSVEDAWTAFSMEFTATTALAVITFVTPTTSTDIIYGDNVTLTQIGCVLDLNPTGITSTKWIDNSGNNLDGTITAGATAPIVTNPQAGLYIAEAGATSPKFEIDETGKAVFQNTTDSVTAVQVLDADGGTPVLNVDTTNEWVGIGTAAPTTKLHVYNATGNIFIRNETDDGSRSQFISLNTVGQSYFGTEGTAAATFPATFEGATLVGASTDDPVHFIQNSAIAATIDASSNLGIATTAPDAALEINHATGDNLRLTYNDANGSATYYADLQTTATGNLTVTPSGGLTSIVGGQIKSTTAIAAGTYDLLVTDYFLNCDYTATAAITSLTLPTAQLADGRVIHVKDTGGLAGTNNITIDTEGAETIDGAATAVISTNYNSISLYCDGTNWFIY
jgi:hypothetical protein